MNIALVKNKSDQSDQHYREMFQVMTRRATAFYLNQRYDRKHQKQANTLYSAIVAQDPSAALIPRIQKKIKAYAHEVLGSDRFIPWLKVYAAYSGQFKEGWLPDNYFGRVVLPLIQGTHRNLSQAKTISRRLLGTDLIPDIAYYVNGVWIDTDGDTIQPQDLALLLFEQDERVFVKLDCSNQGRGVFVVERDSFVMEDLAGLGNFVVQRPIRQSEFFNQFCTENVATLRITTVKAAGTPARMCASYLRLGRATQAVISSSHLIRIPVIDQNGTLSELASMPNWQKTTSHPDTGTPFGGLVIPSFKEAVTACTSLHDALPHITLIGWDTTINKSENVEIIEWNSGHPGIKFTEASAGPCFKDFGWEHLWRQSSPSYPTLRKYKNKNQLWARD